MDYRIGMVITGRVTGIQPYGAFVLLDDNTQGLIHISELKHGFVSNVGDYLKVGQMVKVMVVDIDEYTGKISLSLRCLEQPFNFNYQRDEISRRYKRYWSDRHVDIGFKPIAERLDHWVESALDDIENGK